MVPLAVDLPSEVCDYFDGHNLTGKMRAGELLSVDADGWPRTALLSVGEILVVADSSIRIGLWRGTRTAQNLSRSGRALLVVVLGPRVFKLPSVFDRVEHIDHELEFFVGFARAVDVDEVDYATVLNGLDFQLLQPEVVIPRWKRTIATLRSLDAAGDDG